MLEGNKMAEWGRSGRSGRKSQVFKSQKLKNNRGWTSEPCDPIGPCTHWCMTMRRPLCGPLPWAKPLTEVQDRFPSNIWMCSTKIGEICVIRAYRRPWCYWSMARPVYKHLWCHGCKMMEGYDTETLGSLFASVAGHGSPTLPDHSSEAWWRFFCNP